ncbi:hypothetical protein ACFVWT_01335 [Arthrobacter sp. NPDC058288]|uniref:hypothetical protein n=1 Tax=Arthrobacter sp. NPDC058288 TaxID=3346424 RepID=UPI0036E0B5E1
MTLSVMIMLAFSAAVAAAAGPPPASTAPAPAGIGIRLLDIPASTKDDPRARTYIIDRLAPGAEISRRIQVENNTGSAQMIRLYAGAARIDGGSFIGEDAGSKNDLSTWTAVGQPQVNVAAGAKAEVPVTIKVPSDAPESEQYGAVWAEVRSAAGQGGVVQANRVGIRVYLSVGPGNGKPADFTITSLTPSRDEQGNPQLSALVTNTGGRALDVTGDLRLAAGPGGLSAGPFGIQNATTIAPGKAQNVIFTLPSELPDGPWTVNVGLRSGLMEREASAPVTFPAAGPGEAVSPAPDSEMPWLVPAAVAAALAITALLSVLLLRRQRPSGRNTAVPADGTRRATRRNADVTR